VKAYRFRLGSVARVRALEERVARERLMVALRDVRHAEEAAEAAQCALEALAMPEGTVTAADLVWLGEQAERLSDALAARRRALADAVSTRETARLAWGASAKRAEVLERLDEQARAQWLADMLRQEGAELDDLAMVRRGWTGAVP
jgi:flagellar export protein FliJ